MYYLFRSLFGDGFLVRSYIKSSVVNDKLEGYRGTQPWPILKYCYTICQQSFMKVMKSLFANNRLADLPATKQEY